MYEEMRTCPKCKNQISEELFSWCGEKSPGGVSGRSSVCVSCLGKEIDPENLDTVDRVCQFLDLPFDPNLWIDLQKDEPLVNKVLLEYADQIRHGRYKEETWFSTNKMWEKARQYNAVLEKVDVIKPDLLLYLRRKWGSVEGFALEQYLKLEEYERHTLNHYNFKDEARRDIVRKLAKLSVLSDEALNDRDDKKANNLLQSYNSLMKESGIRTEKIKDENTIESLSELVSYLEKTGFLLNHRVIEKRDVVDKTIANFQQYVRRLFSDSNETINEMFQSSVASQKGGTAVTDSDFDRICEDVEDERDEVELEESLDEKELQVMLGKIEAEYE